MRIIAREKAHLGKTISDDIDISKINEIKYFDIYFRSRVDSPNGRSNWLLDLCFFDNYMEGIKLPPTLSREEVINYLKPMESLFGEIHISEMDELLRISDLK